ncbi:MULTISPECIES: ribosome maturation factor RimM [Eikenella]|uniref:Ribosome maturation factor RimM n=1 Tax=Eikenella longinqua TaxID=1795827 RepID=A0A1A9S116_9NEIS|nr:MULTISPECIES: ribosome maturation factor RimM [Eikenella]OAM30082.1 ribosome maturation factor RimM [Eikenella longinqua]
MSRSQDKWIAMGYVKGAFGVKGWVKVAVGTEYADSLLDYPVWRLSKDGASHSYTLESGQVAGDELQVKFAEIGDRDAAQLLRGHTIEIHRSDFEPAEEGEYYWADLVGLAVHNRQGELVGTVSNLMETGAHDILVVDGEHGRKLIPFVEHYIDSVDLEAGGIVADWGLDY